MKDFFTIQLEKEKYYDTIDCNEIVLATTLTDALFSIHPIKPVHHNIQAIQSLFHVITRIPLATTGIIDDPDESGEIHAYHLAENAETTELGCVNTMIVWMEHVIERCDKDKIALCDSVRKEMKHGMNIIEELFDRKRTFSMHELERSMGQINAMVDSVKVEDKQAECRETVDRDFRIKIPVETYNLGLAKYFYEYLIPDMCMVGSYLWEILTNIRVRKDTLEEAAYVCTNALFTRTLTNDIKHQVPKMMIVDLPTQIKERDENILVFIFYNKVTVTLSTK